MSSTTRSRLSAGYLSGSEVEALVAAAGHGRLVVLTLAYSGLRWGELAALRVRDVDLLRGRLRVRRPVTEVNGCLVVDYAEGQRGAVGAGARVPATRARAGGRTVVALTIFSSRRRVAGSSGCVRHGGRGSTLAVAAAGLLGLTPSELRHTAASLAVARRRQRPGGAADARPREGKHDAGRLLRTLFDGDLDDRRRTPRFGARPRSCGLPADRGGSECRASGVVVMTFPRGRNRS